MVLEFTNCNLTGDSFDSGAFQGAPNHIELSFFNMEINFIPESIFKPVLDNKFSMIRMNYQKGEPRGAPTRNSTIDCSDCKNHWLIKEGKESQVFLM